MSIELENRVNRRLTTEFINADPKEIRLIRRVREPNGSGGFRWVDDPASPLPPQVGRLIPANRQLNERETSTGTKVIAELALLMEHNADVKRFDQFVDQGITYEVVWVHEKRVYETKAEVASLRGNS